MKDSKRIELVRLMQDRSELKNDEFARRLMDILGNEHLGWELGPDPIDHHITVLSLSVQYSSESGKDFSSISKSPVQMDDWRIQLGIPPRLWEKYFEYTSSAGREYAVEGANWKFSLTAGSSGALIDLVPDMPIEQDDAAELACVLLTGELGERNLTEFVDNFRVSFVRNNKMKPMDCFRLAFSRAYPSCHYRKLFALE